MKVFVIGTRGIPGIPGGVEQHCEQLYPLIAKNNIRVKLSRRSSYVKDKLREWKGVELVDIYSPKTKSLEAIIHTSLSIIYAKFWGADIVHIHAIGPAIMTPLARILRMRVVVTNHGPDYDRQKWGGLAKSILRLGEYLGCKYANEVIVISEHIRGIVQKRCSRDSNLIYNGVPIPELVTSTSYIKSLSLAPQGYIIAVARLVPEKGLNDLIDAFEALDSDVKLVIAGDSDHEDSYSKGLKNRAKLNDNIFMPGYVTGSDLEQLFTHARLFAMPSYHEGLPIALLEALSYGLPVVVSDIPANAEVGLASGCYFPVGNVELLTHTITSWLKLDINESYKLNIQSWVSRKYNWDNISNSTISMYQSLNRA